MELEPIRIGMIGAGSISNAHLTALQTRDDAELVCIADMNEEMAETQAEKYGARCTVRSYDELVERDDIDAVIVGIPTRFHADATVKAARHGKHVLCEKPMARTLEECDAMIEAAEAAGVVLQIAFVRRFDPEWGKLRELIHAGKVGRPCMWRVMHAGPDPQPPRYGDWYHKWEFSDGPIAENGIHDLDFLRHTFGAVKSVTGSNWKLGRVGDVPDMATTIVDFVSGDQALVLWSWSLPQGCRGGTISGIDVLGPDGCLRQPRSVNGDEWQIVAALADGAEEDIRFTMRRDHTNWFGGQLANFIESIKGNETPLASGSEGRKSQQIVVAAFESQRTGRRVEISNA